LRAKFHAFITKCIILAPICCTVWKNVGEPVTSQLKHLLAENEWRSMYNRWQAQMSVVWW